MTLADELARGPKIGLDPRIAECKRLFHVEKWRPTDIAIHLDIAKTTVWRWANDVKQKRAPRS